VHIHFMTGKGMGVDCQVGDDEKSKNKNSLSPKVSQS